MSMAKYLDNVISAIGGVIRPPTPVAMKPWDPQGVYLWRAGVGNGPVWLNPGFSGSLDGAGIDQDPALARRKAICEAAEHYAASVLCRNHFRVTSARSLGSDAIDVGALPRRTFLRDGTLGSHAVALDDPIRWVKGWRLPSFDEVWVPAAMVYLWLSDRSPAETFWPALSTGAAAHPNPSDAISHGLLECVERDAVALWWLTRSPGTDITRMPAGQPLSELRMSIDNSMLSLRLYDITRSDVDIPTVLAIARGSPPYFAGTTVGASSSLDFGASSVKAILEAIQVQVMLRGVISGTCSVPLIARGAAFMAAPQRAGLFSFVDIAVRYRQCSRPNLVPQEDPHWRTLVDRLASVGLVAYVVDLTTEDLRDVGLTAVKVIVPKLQPLNFGMSMPFLSERLIAACTTSGVALTDINLVPNPLG